MFSQLSGLELQLFGGMLILALTIEVVTRLIGRPVTMRISDEARNA